MISPKKRNWGYTVQRESPFSRSAPEKHKKAKKIASAVALISIALLVIAGVSMIYSSMSSVSVTRTSDKMQSELTYNATKPTEARNTTGRPNNRPEIGTVPTRDVEITDRLVWSTYLGSIAGLEEIRDVAVGPDGSIYVCGNVSTDLPSLAGVPGWSQAITGSSDAFLARFAANGTNLIYYTTFGAAGYDCAYSVDVNASGFAVIAGQSTGAGGTWTIPSISGGGSHDAFLALFDPTGTNLEWSHSFGGYDGAESVRSVRFDQFSNPVVAGVTTSTDFLHTESGTGVNAGKHDAFVGRFRRDGRMINGSDECWLTLFGGAEDDWANGTVTNLLNETFVVGYTESSDLPIYAGAYNSTYGGAGDAFLSKIILNESGLVEVNSTFIGGAQIDVAEDIDIGTSNTSMALCGWTASGDFPTTDGAFNRTWDDKKGSYSAYDGFVANMTANLNLTWSTGINSRWLEQLYAIDVSNETGWIAVAGRSSFGDGAYVPNGYPIMPGAAFGNGQQHAVVVSVLDPIGSRLIYSSACRGAENEAANGVGFQNATSVVIGGKTNTHTNGLDRQYPVTTGAWDTSINGNTECIVSVFPIDNHIPTLYGETGPEIIEPGQNASFSVHVADDDELADSGARIVRVNLDGSWHDLSNDTSVKTLWSANISDTWDLEGAPEWYITAFDHVGNENSTGTQTFTLGVAPSFIDVNYSRTIQKGEALVVSAEVTDDLSDVSEVQLIIGVDVIEMEENINEWWAASITLNNTGDQEFYLVTEDAYGQRRSTRNYTVTVTGVAEEEFEQPGRDIEELPPIVPSFIWYIITALVGASVIILSAFTQATKGISAIIAGGVLFTYAFVMISYSLASTPLEEIVIDPEGTEEDRSTDWPVGVVLLIILAVVGWSFATAYLGRLGLGIGGLVAFAVITILSFVALSPSALLTTGSLFAWAMLAQTASFGLLLGSKWIGRYGIAGSILLGCLAGILLGWYSVVQAINWFQGPPATVPEPTITTNSTGGA